MASAPPSPPMTIHCPHCLTGYELPRNLMGEHGSRVRCPACQGVFVVLPEGVQSVADAAPSPEEAASEPGPADRDVRVSAEAAEEAGAYDPSVVAGAVLDVMVDFLGDSLRRSRARGTVLSDHGPAIVAVWEEYRRRVGDDAPAGEFRSALKERVGIDLTPRA
jgi:predicted Zn finger-like uncharacterized protein